MAGLPSLNQVAGMNAAMYEALYQQVDPADTDRVGAMEAATFLKKSRLPDSVLSKVWDLSDPTGKGFLDKRGFFVALKLVALAQAGKELSLALITTPLAPPVMGDSGQSSGLMSPAADWTIKPNDKAKYEELFSSLGPVGDRVPGNLVKPIMLNSKLPTDVLGKIWELSDMDQDGFLDRDEFILAMHLMCRAMSGVVIPPNIPAELVPASKRKNSSSIMGGVMPDLLPGMDGLIRRSSTPTVDIKNALNKSVAPWVVGAGEKAQSDDLFRTLDTDYDGFVTGLDIKGTLLQSGLSPAVLAHIWNLCDMKQTGKLSSEQFALAMYLVRIKLQGTELPQNLTPEMVPPTLRPKPSADNTTPALIPASVTEPEPLSTGNKDLDMVGNEIKELQKEKLLLEEDISEREVELKRKGAEVLGLSREQETLLAMLKQLEVQKAEAVKRLSDLGVQQSALESSLAELQSQVSEETAKVDNLRTKVEDQKKSLETQEDELNTRRQELNDLRQEEQSLEQQITSGQGSLAGISKGLQDTRLQISQSQAKITLFQEKQRQMEDGISLFDGALTSGDVSSLSDLSLCAPASLSDLDYRIAPETMGGSSVSFSSSIEGISGSPKNSQGDEDPFKSKDPFGAVNGFDVDPFAGTDPFTGVAVAQDFFAPDPFQSTSDPFAAPDTFDPFGGPGGAHNPSSNQGFGADPFGADPFQPVAPPRPESPMPALPPKKSKAPPPRPAPPRQPGPVTTKTGPTRAAPAPPPPPAAATAAPIVNSFYHDPFSGAPVGKDPFAAAFDSNGDVSKELAPSADPFGCSDPFGGSSRFGCSDPFDGSSQKVAVVGDPFASTGDASANDSFANFADFDKFSAPPPYFPPETPEKPPQRCDSLMTEEERQVAWAKQESFRCERDRQQRAQQEQADLEMALALSRQQKTADKKTKKRKGKGVGLF